MHSNDSKKGWYSILMKCNNDMSKLGNLGGGRHLILATEISSFSPWQFQQTEASYNNVIWHCMVTDVFGLREQL